MRCVRTVGLSVALGVSAGCSAAEPGAPVDSRPRFPPAPANALVFSHVYDPLAASFRFNQNTRFVLCDDDTFVLQYLAGAGTFEFVGTYTRNDSLLVLDFRDFSDYTADNAQDAVGVLRGDSLTVRYGVYMSMSDFMDGLYVRDP